MKYQLILTNNKYFNLNINIWKFSHFSNLTSVTFTSYGVYLKGFIGFPLQAVRFFRSLP